MTDRKSRLCLALWLLIGAGEAFSVRAALRDPVLEGRFDVPRTSSTDVDTDTVFAGESRLEVDRLVGAVLRRSVTLRSARSALQAALLRPEQARSLADPRVSYTFAPRSIASNDVGYGHVLSYSQRLPHAGKRGLRRDIARAEAESVAHDVEALRLRLATAASLLFYDY